MNGDKNETSKLLKKLLSEVPTNKKSDPKIVQQLIDRTVEMNQLAPERAKKVEEYFQTLKERLEESSVFLEKTKKELENIKAAYEKQKDDNLNSMNYLEFMDKSNEEIDTEMRNVLGKLDDLQVQVDKYKVKHGLKDKNQPIYNFSETNCSETVEKKILKE